MYEGNISKQYILITHIELKTISIAQWHWTRERISILHILLSLLENITKSIPIVRMSLKWFRTNLA
jgi:hypothetical protein